MWYLQYLFYLFDVFRRFPSGVKFQMYGMFFVFYMIFMFVGEKILRPVAGDVLRHGAVLGIISFWKQ